MQFFEFDLAPFPFICTFSEFLPSQNAISVLVPLVKDVVNFIGLNMRHLPNDALVRLEALHQL